jgi:hypothetical protein
MTVSGDYDDVMDAFVLDELEADRLLAGLVAPQDAPEGYAPVALLVQTARRPAAPGEIPPMPRPLAPVLTLKPGSSHRLAKVAAISSALVLGISAAAAATGSLPATIQRNVATIADHMGVSLPSPHDKGSPGRPSGTPGNRTPGTPQGNGVGGGKPADSPGNHQPGTPPASPPGNATGHSDGKGNDNPGTPPESPPGNANANAVGQDAATADTTAPDAPPSSAAGNAYAKGRTTTTVATPPPPKKTPSSSPPVTTTVAPPTTADVNGNGNGKGKGQDKGQDKGNSDPGNPQGTTLDGAGNGRGNHGNQGGGQP